MLIKVIMDPPSRKISKPERDLSRVVLTLENAITAPQFCTIALYERRYWGIERHECQSMASFI
jgi:hypothetical protein